MSNSPYTKLPGRGWTWTGPSRVWLGENHVLLVLNRTFFENYRRFFLKDIQAVIIKRTHIGKTWNGIWAVGFIFLTAIALAVNHPVGTPILAALAAPFGIVLVINVVLGPTCACYIRTAVQIERLPAVSRLRAARKFLAVVEPLIVEAQGQREELTTELAVLQGGAQTFSTDAPPVVGS